MLSESAMKSFAIFLLLFWVLVGAVAIVKAVNAAPAPLPAKTSEAVNLQFATTFCYRQYNNQSDVTACLSRHLNR